MHRTIQKFTSFIRKLFGQGICRIEHPSVYTNDQLIEVGREYLLKERMRPIKEVIVKQIHHDHDHLRLKLFSIHEQRYFWMMTSLSEQYSHQYDWRLLDRDSLFSTKAEAS